MRGAEPGDSLVVELLEIRPGPRGFATIIPEFGQLIDAVKSPVTYVFDVDEETIRMNDRISFPLRPMVGVVGVATDGEEITNGWAGRHGGNLDDHKHGPGAKLFFPVRQPGGMFAVGDMHASMGDGEICGTGVEIGGEVVARFDVLKGKQAVWPVTELPDALADARHLRRRLPRGHAGRDRGGGEAARRPVGLLDGGGVRLPLRRLRRRHLPGLQAVAVQRDRARLDPEAQRDAGSVQLAATNRCQTRL